VNGGRFYLEQTSEKKSKGLGAAVLSLGILAIKKLSIEQTRTPGKYEELGRKKGPDRL